METSVKKLEEIASQVRRDIIRMVSSINSGHPGGSMSAADVIVALFFDVMDPAVTDFTTKGQGHDVFYLSNGHISPALYSVLARRGYFDPKELGTF
ncbi:MAG: transketolase, partial [Mucinivorans sp.]